jgi:GT2 family glycosyltransferase
VTSADPRCRHIIKRIDLCGTIADITLPQDCSGVALDVREGKRPIGFVLIDKPGGSILSSQSVAETIDQKILEKNDCDQEGFPKIDGGMPSVTIAICTKDHPDLVRRCLSSFRALVRYPRDPIPDILVVDNASYDDATRRVVEAFPEARYIHEECVGLNFARNRALAETKGEILAFIDDDVIVDPYWLLGLRQAWARCPEAGAFTGQTLPFEIETQAQLLMERIGGFRKGFQSTIFDSCSETDPLYPCTTIFGNGCNMAFRVPIIRRLEGFDEALDTGRSLPGGGDLDALYRVVRHGHKLVYEPQMLVFHQHRRDMTSFRRQIRRSWGAGCMAFLTKVRDFDPDMGDKARTMIRWWVKDLALRLVKRRQCNPQPWSLVLQEFIGATMSLTGTYKRSVRRAARIRRAAATPLQ